MIFICHNEQIVLVMVKLIGPHCGYKKASMTKLKHFLIILTVTIGNPAVARVSRPYWWHSRDLCP